MSLEVGQIVDGKVSGIKSFGAFVSLDSGQTGLVHISEVAGEYVDDINKYLKNGQSVKVYVTAIDDNGKISLSIRRANEEIEKAKPTQPAQFEWSHDEDANLSFEDKMNKFKKASDEKLHDIKRNVESKRGGYKKGYSSY